MTSRCARHSCLFIRAACVSAAFAAMAILPSYADTYQFIISGYPAANENRTAVSSGTVLVSAARTAHSFAQALEARYRTWCKSNGIGFRSDRPRGFVITYK